MTSKMVQFKKIWLIVIVIVVFSFQVLIIFYQLDSEGHSHYWSIRASYKKAVRNLPRVEKTLPSSASVDRILDADFKSILPLQSLSINNEKGEYGGSAPGPDSVMEALLEARETAIIQGGTALEDRTRVACIIPYTGTSFPAWFDAFAFTAYASASMFDFLIFVTDIPNRDVPPNVKIIQIEKSDLYERIIRLDSKEYSSKSFSIAFRAVKNLVELFPYVLVEFKPCLGVLFADYLTEYSHWALADLDMLLGNMHEIITPSILDKYDIYTSSFGDSYRMYLRGQLTIHRNTPYINNIWRGCNHLSDISSRLFQFSDSGYRSWGFESAEGCYSAVAVGSANVTILVATTQISDAYFSKVPDRESFLYGNSLYRCYNAPPKISDTGSPLDKVDFTKKRFGGSWTLDSSDSAEWAPLFRLLYDCSRWIHLDYQVCLSYVPSAVVLLVRSGYVTFREEPKDEATAEVKINCREGAISHFQAWKKQYYHFFTRPPPLDSHVTLITATGFIPFKFRPLGPQELSERTYGTMLNLTLAYGMISADEVHELRGRGLEREGRGGAGRKTGRDGVRRKGSLIRRLVGASDGTERQAKGNVEETEKGRNVWKDASFEMESVEETWEAREGMSTSYCLASSKDLKTCNCNVRGDQIRIFYSREIAYPPPSSSSSSSSSSSFSSFSHFASFSSPSSSASARTKCTHSSPVTLISAASAEHLYGGDMSELLHSWCGPKIVVISVTDLGSKIPESFLDHFIDLTVIEVDVRTCLRDRSFIPDKVLFNIGLDASTTDLVCITPSDAVHQSTAAKSILNALSEMGPSGLSGMGSAPQGSRGEGPRGSHWGGLGGAQPAALVVPLYSKADDDNVTDWKQAMNITPPTSSSTPSYVSYPSSSSSWCGDQQSPLLKKIYSFSPPSPGEGLEQITPNKKDLLLERTLLLPVAYNTTAGPHGKGFVRFPEELNGSGCYGSSFLAVLLGSGFDLFWAPFPAFMAHKSQNDENVDPLVSANYDNKNSEGSGKKSKSSGHMMSRVFEEGCMCGLDPGAAKEFLNVMQKYYERAATFRQNGISTVYAIKEFGENFETYQKEQVLILNKDNNENLHGKK